MDNVLFEHEEHGRNWVMKILLAIGVAFVLLAFKGGAPWFWYIGPGLFVLMAGWRVVANPKSGSRLTREVLQVYSGRWRRELPVSDIDRFILLEWSDGPPGVEAMLKWGESVSIPFQCIGRSQVFVAALKTMGIAVERK